MNNEKILRKAILKKVKEYYRIIYGNSNQDIIKKKKKIRYAGRVFNEEEIVNLVESSLDFWLTEGRYSEEFSHRLASFFDVSNAILVNSGSSANLLAISALTSDKLKERRFKPDDEVITVAASFPSTVAPIVQNNLIPVFVDVDLGTYNIKTERISEAITPKTKAIFIAHTMGNPFDLNKVLEIVNEYNLWLIEDNCDALGSKFRGRLTGTFGHLATLSFYPAHHITTGEGGCIITNDKGIAKIVQSFRDWGRDCYCKSGENNTCGRRFNQQFGTLPYGYDHKYVYSHIGYNLKMTDMQAAIGCAQLNKLDGFIERRKLNFIKLYKGLKSFEDYLILPRSTKGSDPSWFSFVITIKENNKFSRNDLVKFLNENKVETRNLFSGNLLKHPAFKGIKHRIVGNLKNTDLITNNSFFIGVYPGLSDQDINYIIDKIKQFFDYL